jgi:hypothetical protein
MSEFEGVQAELRDIVRRLAEIERRLKGVVASLPSGDDPETQDTATEIRAVIECVLLDSIGPATRDLRSAAEYSGRPEKEEEGEDREA